MTHYSGTADGDEHIQICFAANDMNAVANPYGVWYHYKIYGQNYHEVDLLSN